jgi:hypothetical protein
MVYVNIYRICYLSPEYSSISPIEENNCIKIVNTNIDQFKGKYPDAELFLASQYNFEKW